MAAVRGRRIPDFLTTVEAPTGPSLWRRGETWDERVPVELHIETPASGAEEYSYFGGGPRCRQPPIQVPGRFFFQLDGGEGWDGEPGALNFGGGTGYAYLSQDEREGRFFWDCV